MPRLIIMILIGEIDNCLNWNVLIDWNDEYWSAHCILHWVNHVESLIYT
jgi:hypothetical protein